MLAELLEVLGAGDTCSCLTTFVQVVTCMYCYGVPPRLLPCLCWLCFWPWACRCPFAAAVAPCTACGDSLSRCRFVVAGSWASLISDQFLVAR